MVSLSRLFATKKMYFVIAGLLVLVLTALAVQDMVKINHSLQSQQNTIQYLDHTKDQLDSTIKTQTDIKKQKQNEVEKLEKIHQDLDNEHKTLEEELQA